HVARTHIAQIALNRFGEPEQTRIGIPVRLRLVLEVEAIFLRRDFGHDRLEKEVFVRLGDECKYRNQRPGEDPSLSPWQGRYGFAPGDKPPFVTAAAVEEVEEAGCEGARADFGFHGVTE